ncbi:MAG: hypothetical protein PHW79_07765 [Candidatus Marinimicrobia bacterium]|nr:hypothetical protein [Candidatus Neomarinimicrobiota bacterium]
MIKTITDTVGTFLFDTGKYTDGTYTMTIDLYVSTNSGSLADVSKVEAIHAWRELKVIIDNSTPSQVQIQTTSPFSGGLTITWQKYPKRNFAKYVLYRYQVDEGYYDNGTKLTEILSSDVTTFNDLTYFGQSAAYKIIIYTQNGKNISHSVECQYKSVKVNSTRGLTDGRLEMKWNSCYFSEKFAYYQLYRGEDLIVQLSEIKDTVFIDSLAYFDYQNKYRLVTVSKMSGVTMTHSLRAASGVPLKDGDKFIYPNNVTYIPQTDSYYLDKISKVYRLDANTMAIQAMKYIEDSRGGFCISADGSTAYMSANTNIFEIDPVTLNVLDTIVTTDIIGYESHPCQTLHLSLTNWLIYPGYTLTANNIYMVDRVFILDMSQRKIVGEAPLNGIEYEVNISNDGKMISIFDRIFQLNTNQPPDYDYISQQTVAFMPTDEFYLTESDGVIHVRRLTDHAVVDSWNTPTESIIRLCVDPVTGYIGCQAYNTFFIYDPNSHALLKQIHIRNDRYFLRNSILFSSEGYYLPLTFGKGVNK